MKLRTIGVLLVAILVVGACGPASSSSPAPTVAATAAASAAAAGGFDRTALIEAARKEGKMVFYGVSPTDFVAKLLAAFKKAYPFMDVSEFYRDTSGKVMAKVDAEHQAKQPIADVLTFGSPTQVIQLKAKNLLAKIATPEATKVTKELQDPGYWVVYRVSPFILGYNPNKIAAADVPNSWTALAEPKYKGKIGYGDPTFGSTQILWYSLRQTMGADFWDKVAPNNPVAYTGSTPIAEGVVSGELLLAGEMYTWLMFTYSQQKAPLKPIFPKEGSPLSLATVGVSADAPHPAAAQLFVDWLLSLDGQRYIVNGAGDYSSREDVEAAPGYPKFADLKKIYLDSYAKLDASQPDFVKQWTAITRKP